VWAEDRIFLFYSKRGGARSNHCNSKD